VQVDPPVPPEPLVVVTLETVSELPLPPVPPLPLLVAPPAAVPPLPLLDEALLLEEALLLDELVLVPPPELDDVVELFELDVALSESLLSPAVKELPPQPTLSSKQKAGDRRVSRVIT
jgi:hypothetical protein